MNTTQINNGDKGDSSNGVALSSDIEWLFNREGGWQFGEAGVIQAVASKLDCNKIAVEFGGGHSSRKITVQRLIGEGWNVILFEGNDECFDNLKSETEGMKNVKVFNKNVSVEGADCIESCLDQVQCQSPDVFVIDVDGNDIEYMQSMKIRPKVLCIEHHDVCDPSINHLEPVIPDKSEYGKYNKSGYAIQANIAAVNNLAEQIGYKRVWSNRINSIFVLNDLYETVAKIPEDQPEDVYDYDAFGCKRNWMKIENPKVSLILSQPRLCFTDHSDRITALASSLKFNTFRSVGAFWDRDIEMTTKNAIVVDNPDFLLYSDYDSVFNPEDVFKLLEVINNDSTIAAIGSVQMSRHDDRPLVFEADRDYSKTTTKVDYQHFGLTLIRRQVFEELPQPWFWCTPGMWPNGRVGWDAPGRSDADITFWRLLRNANMKVVQHNEVVIGHMVLCVKWPKDTGYGVQLQPIEMYNRHGKPKTATINQEIYRLRMAEEAKRKQEQTNG